MKYISIDGDDIGRKIASCYLSNNASKLKEVSISLTESTDNISKLLISHGFDVLFCAADGIVASIGRDVDFMDIFKSINKMAPKGITFSAGVGSDLRETYVALLTAKSNGKNCLYCYSEIKSNGRV